MFDWLGDYKCLQNPRPVESGSTRWVLLLLLSDNGRRVGGGWEQEMPPNKMGAILRKNAPNLYAAGCEQQRRLMK